ncbi:MAG: hypothetical protein Q4E18_02750 [Clostridia bacterium]|nr:hypothetical protein [Clostridia bacterium]
MATYKYQQDFFDGASYGYVKFNVTPDLGSVLFEGDTFTVTGVFYVRNYTPYGIAVYLQDRAVATQVGGKLLNTSKQKVTPFALTCTVSDYVLQVGKTTADCDITFLISDTKNSLFEGTSTTIPFGEYHEYTIVRGDRKAPIISDVTFTDDAGHATTFGGYVQNQSNLHLSFTETVDAVDPTVSVVSRVLELGTAAGGSFTPLATIDLASTNATIGKLDFAGTLTYRLRVTDNKGLTSETSTGPLTFLPYTAPKITTFTVRRYKLNDENVPVASNTGEHVMVSVAATVTSVGDANAYTAKLRYGIDGGETTTTTDAFASGTDGGEVSIADNASIIPDDIGLTDRIKCELIVTDQFTSTTATVYVERVKAYFAVTPEGVCVGGFPTLGTAANPTFESVPPAHFFGGIFDANGTQIDSDTGWIDLPLAADVTAHDASFATTPQYRKIGNHVYIRGHVYTNVPSGGRAIATLPEGFRPPSGTHYDIGECGGQRISRLYTDVNGNLRCEWVMNIAGAAYTSALWIQIDMDYLVD